MFDPSVHPLRRLSIAVFLLNHGEEFHGNIYDTLCRQAQDVVDLALLAAAFAFSSSDRASIYKDPLYSRVSPFVMLAVAQGVHIYSEGAVALVTELLDRIMPHRRSRVAN